MKLYQALIKASLGLSAFAILTVGLIAFTQVQTEDLILEQKRLLTQKTLSQLIDANAYNNKLTDSTIVLNDSQLLGFKEVQSAYVAWQTQADNPPRITHFILPLLVPDGYSGDIRVLVGIREDGVISGVRVLEHQETPGLGDKIEIKKSPWILTFNAKSLTNPDTAGWQVKKDGGEFDQFTGATITPRALVRGIYRALTYYKNNQITLTESAQTLIKDTKSTP